MDQQINKPTALPWQNAIILFLMLYFTNFWSYRAYTGVPQGIAFLFTYIPLFILLSNSTYLQGKAMANCICWILGSFFLSCIPSVFVFGQGVYEALAGLKMVVSPMLLYFLLHKWNISEDNIYKYLVLFTFVFAFFSIYQQFTYPTYWFGGREEQEWSGLLEERMGFWRFYLFGKDFCALALMLSFGNMLRKAEKTKLYYISFLVCAVAIYFFLARKEIYGAVSCLVLGSLFATKNTGIYAKIMIIVLMIVGYFILSSTMTELNTQTTEELGEESEDFIRFLAANHFIFEFSDSPLYYAFGSGVPAGNNALGRTITYLCETMHYYQDDCGFVGYFSRFGIFGLVIQVIAVIKIIKNYKYIDVSLLLYGVWQLEECFFDFWCTNTRHTAAFAIFLYLIDKSIEKNKEFKGSLITE